MKNFSFSFGIGAVLVLASCSNDDLVVSNVEGTADVPIGFAVSTGNMSRAGANATQLSDEHWEFGVWAYKTATPSENDGKTVMDNYMVGFWNEEIGYKPISSQNLYNTFWYYEGLGKDDNGFTFTPGSSGKSANVSNKSNQYLKYWDKSVDNTWFYAYAPYITTTESESGVTFNAANHKMTFPIITVTNGSDYMYAVIKATNPKTATAINSNQYVNLSFNRLLAKVRVAFYEVVEGYKVELIPYSNYKITSGSWTSFENQAMFAVPAQAKTTTTDGVTTTTYEKCKYVTSAAPQITFGGDDYITPTVNYTNPNTSDAIINIPLWFHTIENGSANNLVLGTSKDKAIVNETLDVLPQASNSECGFTLNLSLKFTALDTYETIDVKGVRVHIPAADCRWLPNRLYTYYFKVTQNVPAKPDNTNTPSETPEINPYLIPIVFDQVTVQDIINTDKEYEINGTPILNP